MRGRGFGYFKCGVSILRKHAQTLAARVARSSLTRDACVSCSLLRPWWRERERAAVVWLVAAALSRYTAPMKGFNQQVADAACAKRMPIPSTSTKEPQRYLCLDHLNLTTVKQGRARCVAYLFGINY